MSDEDKVANIEDNDKLVEPFKQFQKSQLIVDQAKDKIYLLLFEKGIKTRTSFENNKPYINGLLEKSLPEEFKGHNDLFREYYNAKKFDLDLLGPIVSDKVNVARDMRIKKIKPFMRKNYFELLIMFSGESMNPSTPSEKKSAASTKVTSEVDVSRELPKVISPSDISVADVNIDICEGKVLKELDQETGELIDGEVLGKVGGRYDLADEEEEKCNELKDEAREKKVILKKCVDFLSKRLDYYLLYGANLHYIAMQEPFIFTSTLVNDVLERVDVNADVVIEENSELIE